MKVAKAARLRRRIDDLQERRRLVLARRGVRVSVIIPVYNTEPYLPELLSSLDDQGLDQRQLQVILINDGSTDGSGILLDAFAAGHPRATVLHQSNSGWPGQPRNRGLDLATGRWVFFADADDYLAPGALAELADFGDQDDADIVLPRTGRVGTLRNGKPFTESALDIPPRTAFRTFTPHKLVRRSLIETHGVRFPEGKVRLEDGIFFSRCYLLAQRMSILADREYYLLRGRGDGANLTAQRKEPADYQASVARIADNIALLGRGPKMINVLTAELLRRKCLRHYTAGRFPRYSTAMQEEWLRVHRPFLARVATPEVIAQLSRRNAARCALVLTGDRDAVLAGIAKAAVRAT